MAFQDLREWIAHLEKHDELARVQAPVHWDRELGGITRKVSAHFGPALLFENIKEHEHTWCTRVFSNSLGARRRVAMALGLDPEAGDREITVHFKDRFFKPLAPVMVPTGPVKKNVIKGDDVDLFKIPVPRWNMDDGGRYIMTMVSVVTRDPETGDLNVGTYRGMIGSQTTISVLLATSQHWGHHFTKYRRMGKPMPVALVIGADPTLLIASTAPLDHFGYSEYDVSGSLRGAPVELVKCETSDLVVPAHAEMVIEGLISPDTATYEMEGPFAEYVGYYGGMASPKPAIRVQCITHRDDPIFVGGLEGATPGRWTESYHWMNHSKCAVIWQHLEKNRIPNILGVWSSPLTRCTNLRVQIRKIYHGHAKQVAHCIWGSHLMNFNGKMITVVDEDIDIYDDQAVEWALAYRVNAEMGDVVISPGNIGSNLDPSVPLPLRDTMKYGQGRWTAVLLDATINWDLEPQPQYGNKRYPTVATEIDQATLDLMSRRWSEYGINVPDSYPRY